MLTDDEIAGFMGWRGPGAYTKSKLLKIKAAMREAVEREREECAKVCDELANATEPDDFALDLVNEAADLIRMRSKHNPAS